MRLNLSCFDTCHSLSSNCTPRSGLKKKKITLQKEEALEHCGRGRRRRSHQCSRVTVCVQHSIHTYTKARVLNATCRLCLQQHAGIAVSENNKPEQALTDRGPDSMGHISHFKPCMKKTKRAHSVERGHRLNVRHNVMRRHSSRRCVGQPNR